MDSPALIFGLAIFLSSMHSTSLGVTHSGSGITYGYEEYEENVVNRWGRCSRRKELL